MPDKPVQEPTDEYGRHNADTAAIVFLRDLPPPKKRRNPKREAQAAQRKARAINRRVGK